MEETQIILPIKRDPLIEERIAEIFIGIGYGVTALLFFTLFWIPVVALLLMEYRWLLQ